MTVQTALLWLVLALAVVNALVAVVTLRAVIHSSNSADVEGSRRRTTPETGFTLSLDDQFTWPSGATGLVEGNSWVAFVMPGCVGCEVLREEFESDDGERPELVVIAEPGSAPEEAQSYLDDHWSFASARFVAPKSIELLSGLGPPNEFPTLVAVRDGVVVASAHRLQHLRAVLPSSASGAGAQR